MKRKKTKTKDSSYTPLYERVEKKEEEAFPKEKTVINMNICSEFFLHFFYEFFFWLDILFCVSHFDLW